MKKQFAMVLFTVMTFLVSSFCFAMVEISDTGTWPASWPKELEPYRKQARTVTVAHGIQETVYEIPFDNREDFEKAWPYILTLKGSGSRLILEKSPSTYSISGSTSTTGVRILCPSGGVSVTPDGTRLIAGPPWPENIKLKSGELPEYVVHENGKWVPADRSHGKGCMNRARVDLVLITDGKIVDLNRIPLPPDTLIIDNRFKDKKPHNKTDAGGRKLNELREI
jgi:hypothetical protein